jgi:hypothetical protein
VLDGQAPSTRGANFDFLACGRLFTYFKKDDPFGVDAGHYHYFAAFTPFELAFPRFEEPFDTPIGVFFAPLLGGVDPARPRAHEFAAFGNQLLGASPAPTAHTHFYDSDYTVHHRRNYSVFVKSVSKRTWISTECVNDENKRGRMLADGTMSIYREGAQYTSVFPLLNWTLLPGTTEVQSAAQDMETAAQECLAIRSGNLPTAFVGGLSEGGSGVSVMDFRRAKFTPHSTDQVLVLSAASIVLAAPSASLGVTACPANTSQGVAVGQHCDLAHSAALKHVPTDSAEACRASCCADSKCSCWTWTTYERAAASPCTEGEPCCWLKQSTAAFKPAINCTAGYVPRPPAPPPAAPPACVSAGKAWFFSGEATVALGTDVQRGAHCSGQALTTSIQQCNLLGSAVVVGGRSHRTTLLATGGRFSCSVGEADCAWVWHRGLLYALPFAAPNASATSLVVSNEERSGSEFGITQGDNTTLRGQVFTAFLSHGYGNSLAYGYTVTPCGSLDEIDDTLAKLHARVVVVSNRKPVQAVCTLPNSAMPSSDFAGLQAVLWPSTTPLQLFAEDAGCLDIDVAASPALALGVVFQIRVVALGAGEGAAYNISAVAPAEFAPQRAGMDLHLHIAGRRLHGAGCASAGRAGTNVTIALEPNGATATVRCASQRPSGDARVPTPREVLRAKSDDAAELVDENLSPPPPPPPPASFPLYDPLPATAVTFNSTDSALQALFDKGATAEIGNARPFMVTKDETVFNVMEEGAEYNAAWIETQPMAGAMYAARSVRVALNNQLVFVRSQRVDGRLPHRVDPCKGEVSSCTHLQPGWGLDIQGLYMATPAVDVAFYMKLQKGNKAAEYLQELYTSLSKEDNYLWTTRNDSTCVGLRSNEIVAHNCPSKPSSGSANTRGLLWSNGTGDTGEDHTTKFCRKEINGKWTQCESTVLSMDMAGYSHDLRRALARICAFLGNATCERTWKAKATKIAASVKAGLWRESKAAMYDRYSDDSWVSTLQHNNIRMMWLGAFDQAMADVFVSKHLMNTSEFWTKCPLPSIAASDPHFANSRGNNWSGPPEGLTFQRAIRALEAYGHHAESILAGLGLTSALLSATGCRADVSKCQFPQQVRMLPRCPWCSWCPPSLPLSADSVATDRPLHRHPGAGRRVRPDDHVAARVHRQTGWHRRRAGRHIHRRRDPILRGLRRRQRRDENGLHADAREPSLCARLWP